MKESKHKKLKGIHIHLHHSPDGENDGFEIEHHYEQEGKGEYEPPEAMGIHTHHGSVMEHIHEHIKDHGRDLSETQEEKGEKEDINCMGCSPSAEKMVKHDKTNLMKHGEHVTGHSKAHPGFKNVQKKIAAKEGLSQKAAGAILASRTRHASAAAHKANPHLNRVKG